MAVYDSFVATVPKTAVAPGVPYTFKAVAWTADADWTSEDDAIYYRETTFSFQ